MARLHMSHHARQCNADAVSFGRCRVTCTLLKTLRDELSTSLHCIAVYQSRPVLRLQRHGAIPEQGGDAGCLWHTAWPRVSDIMLPCAYLGQQRLIL